MKNLYLILTAFIFSFFVNTAYAAPTELLVYAINLKQKQLRELTFTVELYQEGNPTPLHQTVIHKPNCSISDSRTALTCSSLATLDLPSKFTAVSGIVGYTVVLKPHDVNFALQVSQDIVVNHDSDSNTKITVEPFRLVAVANRIFETAVLKRIFIANQKNFYLTPIPKEIVEVALRETYLELKNIRKIGELNAFIALIDLWRGYYAVNDENLLAVLIKDVRFENPENDYAAIQILETEGIDTGMVPPDPLPSPGQ